ncbi:MAG: hypothetical protein WCO35_03890 [Candidatus Nomurabacteria bacterium]
MFTFTVRQQRVAIVVILVLISTVCILCNKTQKKDEKENLFTQKIENKKDFQFIQLLDEPDSNLLDSYSLPLVEQGWYTRSTKNNLWTPINESQYTFLELDSSDQEKDSMNILRIGGDVKSVITQTPIQDGVGVKMLKVRLLLLGERKIKPVFTGTTIEYYLE